MGLLVICGREGAGSRVAAWSRILLAFCLFLSAGAARAEERSVAIFEGRKISASVPKGWKFGEASDPRTGVQTLEWLDPSGEVQLDISFLPDSKGRLATRAGLEAEMKRTFPFYLAEAVEREMKFTSLETADGRCEYTSFTDRRLVGREIPEGERLISTTGIRSWKGVYLLFTLLSNSRDTEAFRRALEIVRSGVKEVGGQAPSGESGSKPIRLTLPWAPWVLTLPGDGAKVIERKITPSEIGEVSVVECFVPEARGVPVRQQHLFAEFVVKGYWVDMHVSKVLYKPEDREQIERLVKGVSFHSKAISD